MDVNPFPLDPVTGQGTGRGAALARLCPGFRLPGIGGPILPCGSLLGAELPVIPPIPPLLTPSTSSVPRPWFPQMSLPPRDDVPTTGVVPPSSPPPTSPEVVATPMSVDAGVNEPSTSWGDQVEAAEARGELASGPASPSPTAELGGLDPATEVLSTPEELDNPDESVWDVLARATAAAEEFMGEPEAPSEPPLHPSQATLLDLVRPHWLQGEAGIAVNVCALIHDHGLDYSAAALDRALAWLLLQRRDIATYLRAWLACRMEADEDPRQILRDPNFHLLTLEHN